MQLNKGIIIFLFIFLSFHIYSEEKGESGKTNVAVTKILNRSGHPEIGKAAVKIETVTCQTLKLLGKYNVVFEEKEIGTGEFRNYCEATDTEYIIRGTIIKNDEGILIELSVYDYFSDSIIISRSETAGSPIELRKSVKTVISRTLSYLSKVPVFFTSLAFTNMTDEKGEYSVYIDNIFFGKDIDYLEYMMSGKRNIRIEQERMFGRHNIAEINALLIPEDRLSIEFTIPPLLKNEEKTISRYKNTIDRYINEKYKSQKVGNSFAKLFSLLENPAFSETAAKRKNEITVLHEKWLKNMEKWGSVKGFTTADMPYSVGVKSMFIISSNDITDWDMGGSDPEGKTATSSGFGVTMSGDLFKYGGIQAEALVINQKTKTSYPSGYLPENFSEIETSVWFLEAPAILYFRIPEYLIRVYSGLSCKYRITTMKTEGTFLATGEKTEGKYDEELLRMYLSSWLAGFALDFPFGNSLFSLDFRYNRDLKSWYRSGAPEEDYIAKYIACSLGYTAKF